MAKKPTSENTTQSLASTPSTTSETRSKSGLHFLAWLSNHKVKIALGVVLITLLVTGLYFYYSRDNSEPAPQDTAPASYLENVENAKTVEALENDEDKAAFYASLGALSYSESDLNKALDYYLRSLDLTEEPQGWLYLSIADVYEKQNDGQNALSHYQKALNFYNEAGATEEQYGEEKAYVEEKIGQLQNAE